MNMPTTAEAIDPTASIKKIKNNILWLSLVSLTTTKIVVDLYLAQHSLLIPPFDLLPTNSVFTFCFSFIFVHHGTSFLSLLLGFLFLLICRSFFDFYFYERFSNQIRTEDRNYFTFLAALQERLFNLCNKQKKRKKLLHYPLYRYPENIHKNNILPLTLESEPPIFEIDSRFNSLIPIICDNQKIINSEEQMDLVLDCAHYVSEHIKEDFIKNAFTECYHSFIQHISCLAIPTIGLDVFFYCIFKLISTAGFPSPLQ